MREGGRAARRACKWGGRYEESRKEIPVIVSPCMHVLITLTIFYYTNQVVLQHIMPAYVTKDKVVIYGERKGEGDRKEGGREKS